MRRGWIWVVLIGAGIVLCWLLYTLLTGKLVEHANVSFAVSPKGDLLVFAAADGNLYLLNLRTVQVVPFVHSPIEKSAPAFSPDGSWIVYAEGKGDEQGKHLFVRSLDGKQVRQITKDPGVYDTQPSYSSDGTRLVFARAARRRPYSMGGWTWDQWDVWIVNSDGSQLERITEQKYYELQSLLFLSGRKQIVYAAHQEGTTRLYAVMEQPGAMPRPFGGKPGEGQKGGAWADGPHLSPDGSRLAFISDRVTPFEYDVLLMNTDETEVQPLGVTSVSHYNQNPVFSPDERRLLFLAGTEWNAGSRPIFSLWEVGLEDKKARRIADSDLFTDPAHWKPKH